MEKLLRLSQWRSSSAERCFTSSKPKRAVKSASVVPTVVRAAQRAEKRPMAAVAAVAVAKKRSKKGKNTRTIVASTNNKRRKEQMQTRLLFFVKSLVKSLIYLFFRLNYKK